MTNQEIFDEIGEMGTLMLLFLEMAGADGEVTEIEVSAAMGAGECFTDNDLMPHIDAAVKIFQLLKTEDRINYLAAGLGYFAGKLPVDTKKNILVGMAQIAKADGKIHDNENSLFKMAASYLNA
jgi:uncharacterized tellurite resistance protein B-like protein